MTDAEMRVLATEACKEKSTVQVSNRAMADYITAASPRYMLQALDRISTLEECLRLALANVENWKSNSEALPLAFCKEIIGIKS